MESLAERSLDQGCKDDGESERERRKRRRRKMMRTRMATHNRYTHSPSSSLSPYPMLNAASSFIPPASSHFRVPVSPHDHQKCRGNKEKMHAKIGRRDCDGESGGREMCVLLQTFTPSAAGVFLCALLRMRISLSLQTRTDKTLAGIGTDSFCQVEMLAVRERSFPVRLPLLTLPLTTSSKYSNNFSLSRSSLRPISLSLLLFE